MKNTIYICLHIVYTWLISNVMKNYPDIYIALKSTSICFNTNVMKSTKQWRTSLLTNHLMQYQCIEKDQALTYTHVYKLFAAITMDWKWPSHDIYLVYNVSAAITKEWTWSKTSVYFDFQIVALPLPYQMEAEIPLDWPPTTRWPPTRVTQVTPSHHWPLWRVRQTVHGGHLYQCVPSKVRPYTGEHIDISRTFQLNVLDLFHFECKSVSFCLLDKRMCPLLKLPSFSQVKNIFIYTLTIWKCSDRYEDVY